MGDFPVTLLEGLYKGLPHHSDRTLGLFSQRRSREELLSPASSISTLSQDPHKKLTSIRCDPDRTHDPSPVVPLLMVTGRPELTPCQTISPLCWLALRNPCAQAAGKQKEVANPKD